MCCAVCHLRQVVRWVQCAMPTMCAKVGSASMNAAGDHVCQGNRNIVAPASSGTRCTCTRLARRLTVPYVGFAGCMPDEGSGTACDSLTCPPEEVCTLSPNHTRSDWVLRCRSPLGVSAGGAACASDIECRTGFCGNIGYCIEPCRPEADNEMCIENGGCETVLLPMA